MEKDPKSLLEEYLQEMQSSMDERAKDFAESAEVLVEEDDGEFSAEESQRQPYSFSDASSRKYN